MDGGWRNGSTLRNFLQAGTRFEINKDKDTRCHLSVHSLAQPQIGSGRGSRGSGPGASRNGARCSRSADAAGHDDASRDGCLPSSASHGVAQNNGSGHVLCAVGATSNIAPVAVDAVNLHVHRNEPLDFMLDVATLVLLRMGYG